MGLFQNSRVIRLSINLLFLLLPTIAIFYFAIDKVSNTFKFLERDITTEVIICVAFSSLAFSLHYFKVRTWISFLPFVALLYLLNQSLQQLNFGEFDAFYLQIKVKHYMTLAIIAWLIGYLLARFRYFPYVLSLVCISLGIYLIANQEIFELITILQFYLPILIYTFYAIYIKEIIEDLTDTRFRRLGGFILRISLFIGLLFLTFGVTKYFMKTQFTQYQKEVSNALSNEGKGKNNGAASSKDKLLKENPDGTFDINEIAKLDKRQNTATGNSMKELLFVTYLDNFLSGSDNVPVPYYYVSFYLSKYDTKKEQFIRDNAAPFTDHFNPLPQKLPMLISLTDSNVLKTVNKLKARTTKEVLVYTDKLNPNHFTAPATAYAVEPVPVDPEFKDKYKFAYRAKSYVSYLNEALFVYNSPHPVIEMFNKQRDEVLETDKNFKGLPPEFLSYYTEMPKTLLHDSIAQLAKEIAKGAKSPIEKVVKVRNYFKKKDASGKNIFKYTLEVMKPSEPNIPNQKMLSNFLFKTHKGYCTYYSAASLFMLRSLGIPTRFTAGFLIEDRSAGKNQGWYTVYGSQAHAWIQVYFPNYGWLDFDCTIPAEQDKENAPKPDGTPPLTIPKVYFSGHGKVVSVDTAHKTLVFSMTEMNFKNREYSFKNPPELTIGLAKASIFKNKDLGKIVDIKRGMELSTVVYANIFQKIKLPEEYGSGKAFVDAMPKPTAVDEVHLKIPEPPKAKTKEETAQKEEAMWPYYLLWLVISLIALFFIVFLLLPTIVYWYYKTKANSTKNLDKKAFYIHMLALYICNQLGYYRGNKTTLNYAKQMVDPVFNIGYTNFAYTYLKLKYGGQSLNSQDELVINEFYPRFINEIFSQISTKQKFKLFFNYVMLQKFFALPEEE